MYYSSSIKVRLYGDLFAIKPLNFWWVDHQTGPALPASKEGGLLLPYLSAGFGVKLPEVI